MKKFILLFVTSILSLTVSAQESSIRYDFRGEVSGFTASNKSSQISLAGAHFVQGVNIAQKAFLGIGTGIDYNVPSNTVFLPVFFQGEVGLYETSNVAFSAGARIGAFINPGYNDFSSNISYVNPSIGVSVSHISCSMGFMWLNGRDEVSVDSHKLIGDYNMRGLSLSIAYKFR